MLRAALSTILLVVANRQGAVYGLAIGDLDGDGWPDIAAARDDALNAVWFNTGTSSRARR